MRPSGRPWLLLILTALPASGSSAELAVEYFSSRAVTTVTSTLCQGNHVSLWKKFSAEGIAFNWLDLRTFSEREAVERLTSRTSTLGVLVDLDCPRSMELLEIASRYDLFTLSRSLTSWLIVTNASYETLKTLTENYEPEASDPIEFLTNPYDDKKHEEYLLDINRKFNRDFFTSRNKHGGSGVSATSDVPANTTEMELLMRMKIYPDNPVTLVVPGQSENAHELFGVWKATAESRPRLERMREVEGSRKAPERRRKGNLNGGLLRAATAIFQPEIFTRIDDLSTRESDLWAKMSYALIKNLADDLNFRLIIRFYDDYGWLENGSFGHLIGLLQMKKADLSAAGLLMRKDRFPVVDFLSCPFRLQTGVLFREPSLSSVSNIFVLPFSRTIWVCIGLVIVLVVVVLRCRAVSGRTLVPPDEFISSFFDVGDYVIGAICQQGYSATPASLSGRTSVLVLLLTSVALFTSYSACIVALLQSSSSAILTVGDLARSDLEVGIQEKFPLYKVIIKEATHPVLKEFYQRKILIKGDKAFCDRRKGIERMRTGMFAFEVELTAGYKLISETYEEREKCGIKEIDLIPKPFLCVALPKDSPYRGMFAHRLIWQSETGLVARTWKLWVNQKPKCEVGRIGFISVGLTEFKPVLQVFLYGALTAILFMFLELLHHKKFKIFIKSYRK